jgi:hypothetical protein
MGGNRYEDERGVAYATRNPPHAVLRPVTCLVIEKEVE